MRLFSIVPLFKIKHIGNSLCAFFVGLEPSLIYFWRAVDLCAFMFYSGAMKRILVLCTGNSCRSQMAEGFLRHFSGGRLEVSSAGTRPTEVHPLAVKVMQETGVDIAAQRSKSVAGFTDRNFDCVITVCDEAREACPVFPGRYEKIHWQLEDPARVEGTQEEKLLFFRKVRNSIKEHVLEFLGVPKDSAQLRCLHCGKTQEVLIPQNSCLHFHPCVYCGKILAPTAGSCCVICAYSDKTCPIFSD